MSVEGFIDTNVFIYLFDETDLEKQQRAENLVCESLNSGRGCISHQVVQETLNVVTRKLGARPESARLLLEDVWRPYGESTRRARFTREPFGCTRNTASASTTL